MEHLGLWSCIQTYEHMKFIWMRSKQQKNLHCTHMPPMFARMFFIDCESHKLPSLPYAVQFGSIIYKAYCL